MGTGNLHKWGSQLGTAAGMAISCFPMDSVRLRRIGIGISADEPSRQKARGVCIRCHRDRRNAFCSRFEISGLPGTQYLSGLRLLAHEPQLLRHSAWNAFADDVQCLRLVPMGTGRMGIQSDDSAGQDLVAGLLGSHRTRLWKV